MIILCNGLDQCCKLDNHLMDEYDTKIDDFEVSYYDDKKYIFDDLLIEEIDDELL